MSGPGEAGGSCVAGGNGGWRMEGEGTLLSHPLLQLPLREFKYLDHVDEFGSKELFYSAHINISIHSRALHFVNVVKSCLRLYM